MTEPVQKWEVGGASVRGASHIRRDLPNQDAVACDGERAFRFAAAISDGHGAEPHYRSDAGAKFAVEAAVRMLNWFLDDVAGAAAADDLPAEIVAAWRQLVLAHAAAHPLEGGWVEAEDDKLLVYGATLVAVGARPDLLVLLQLGDGDALLGYADGRVLRPLPDDAGLVGEQTYSLCAADAVSRFRMVVLRRDDPQGLPDFVMLSTDGISKSFVDEKAFLDVGRHYRAVVRQEAVASIVQRLDSWLAEISRRGSGDDVTLCLAACKAV